MNGQIILNNILTADVALISAVRMRLFKAPLSADDIYIIAGIGSSIKIFGLFEK